ncbi:MAG: exodeoxyribonuclease VII small subunit [Chloroflexi bacterium]|nr:exodeoxyribonuclease VII small subunit [Chloroflexota bacterium]
MTDDSHDLTFEQAYERLEAIVARLESGDLSLEEAVALYEQGQVLAQQCGDLLDAAELRVQQLRDDGTLGPLDEL